MMSGNWAGSIISSAGVTTSNAINGWGYQGGVLMAASGVIQGNANVYQNGNPIWTCTIAPAACISIGQFSTIDYIYQTFYWNGARTQVTFYFEPHFTNGMTGAFFRTYTKGGSDNTNNFSAGTTTLSTCTSPAQVQMTNCKIKLLQFGVENAIKDTYSNWDVKQWDMGYAQIGSGNKFLKDIQAYTARWSTGSASNGAWLMYYTSGGTNFVIVIGGEIPSVNADYPLKPGSTLLAGTVKWYPSVSTLPYGTRLW